MNPPRSKNYQAYDKINYPGSNYEVYLNDFNWALLEIFVEAIKQLEGNIKIKKSAYSEQVWPETLILSGENVRKYHHIWELFSE